MDKFKGLLLVALAVLLCGCGGGGSGGGSGTGTPSFNLEPLQPFAGVSDWSMAGGGPSHSGYVPVTLDATTFSPRWSVIVPKGNTDLCDNEDGFFDCVFIYQTVTDSADGHVVVLTDTGFGSANIENRDFTLTSLNEQDGSQTWSRDVALSDDPENEPIFHFMPPTAFDGKVYFSYFVEELASPGSGSPVLQAFDAKTGAKLFSVTPSFSLTQAVVSDSILYAGSPLSAYDAGTGALRWTSADGGSDPTIGPGAVYLSQGEALTALRPTSGSQLFQITGSKQFGAATAPMLDGMGGAVVGVLGSAGVSNKIVTPAKGFLDHYSLATRVRDWTVAGDFSGVMQPVVARGVVYACDGTAVTAYSISDGAKLWSWTGDSSLQDDGSGNSNCSLLVTRNILFVSSNQVTSALDLSTHAVVWSWPEGGKLSLSPSGLLYISVASPAPTHLVAINLH